jgi:hypothetical protein
VITPFSVSNAEAGSIWNPMRHHGITVKRVVPAGEDVADDLRAAFFRRLCGMGFSGRLRNGALVGDQSQKWRFVKAWPEPDLR